MYRKQPLLWEKPKKRLPENGAKRSFCEAKAPAATQGKRVLLDREEKMEFEYIEKTVRKWQHFEVNFGDDISREMFGENLSQTVDILQERSTSVDDRMVRLGLMYNKMKQVDESEELSLDDKKILSKYWYKYAFSKDISDPTVVSSLRLR